ncbi:MAG: hotdog fold thioesterase [Bacteroidota bacterium]|nr:hotdog fold thioesterase [Bacteroidota bacterium]
MPIWFKAYSLQEVQQRGKGTMIEHIGISITEVGDDFLRGTMPIDHRTIQPLGLLHGGASIALAETLGSIAANLIVDPEKKYCVGLDINGNHIRPAKDGIVTGTATPVHLGASTQVWSIIMKNGEEQLICISRLTMAVLDKR